MGLGRQRLPARRKSCYGTAQPMPPQTTLRSAFTVLEPGAAVEETGTGDARSVTVSDALPVGDTAHPQRFLRLEVVR